MKSFKWLPRDMIANQFITLVLSEKEYHKAMSHCGMPISFHGSWLGEGAHATVSHFTDKKGQAICVVALNAANKSPIEICGLLVHESVHVFQGLCKGMGETNPSPEFEAYGIQSIAQRLMAEYARRLT